MTNDPFSARGPAYRWFAWRPVFTNDRGWRWLIMVWRQRVVYDYGHNNGSYFVQWVKI